MPHKRRRRTRAQIEADHERLLAVVGEAPPMTCRQVFYRATVAGLVAKTEAGYDAVCRDLLALRRGGRMPYNWIADATRWQRKPNTYSSVDDALNALASSYRRALWDWQEVFVEVWCENDALAGRGVVELVGGNPAHQAQLHLIRNYAGGNEVLHEALMQKVYKVQTDLPAPTPPPRRSCWWTSSPRTGCCSGPCRAPTRAGTGCPWTWRSTTTAPAPAPSGASCTA
jgi:hypothetical protein